MAVVEKSPVPTARRPGRRLGKGSLQLRNTNHALDLSPLQLLVVMEQHRSNLALPPLPKKAARAILRRGPVAGTVSRRPCCSSGESPAARMEMVIKRDV